MKKLLVVLAACSVVGIATTERSSCLKRVAFSSTNFENILTWETEADILPGTVFDVQYKHGRRMSITKNLKFPIWIQTLSIMEQCIYISLREAANLKYFGLKHCQITRGSSTALWPLDSVLGWYLLLLVM